MSDFARARLEHLRLSILRLLEEAGGDVGETMLRSAVHALGHRPVSLRGELDWLASHGLVEVTEAHGVASARLSEHGYAVAGGQDRVAGVARPRPGDR